MVALKLMRETAALAAAGGFVWTVCTVCALVG